MKKLLALILCVMMFVSIVPTTAFADVGVTTANSGYAWKDKSVAKAAADHARDAIEAMYGSLAANTGVFNTVKSLDDLVTSMSKAMFEGVDDIDNPFGPGKLDNDKLVSITKDYLRNAIGYSIATDMEKRAYSWYDASTGTIDPVKYMNAFAKAASDSIGSAKAQKNIENLMMTLAYFKLWDSLGDEYDDLDDAIADWEDGTAILAKYGFAEASHAWPYAAIPGFNGAITPAEHASLGDTAMAWYAFS